MMQELRPTGQVRLAAGHHLYVGKDGGWRLAGPADTYERLRLPVTVGAALERLLTGRTVYATAIAEAGDSRTLDAALLALHERGLLTDASVTGPELEGGSAVVLGEGSIAHRVAEVLVSSGHQVRRVACPAGSDVMSPDPVSPDLDGASVVVACACWLPDHAWQDLDVRCSRAGLAWHRCHREGTRFVLGPFSVPRHTAGYRDTRARRLAAASQPTELAAFWR
ncbi:MAG: hypothetical protein ACRDTC_07840, partial [Pseudonocardiaceae bacterium]